MAFKDHFSALSSDYARFRPRYPAALFDWLAEVSPSTALAWDVAAGSGQASVELAARFTRVFATDGSAEQLAHAEARPNLTYRHERAERSSLGDASVDLVTVAQALHWFDHPAFFAEAARVMKPGGVLAVWCYEVFEATPALDAIVSRFYHDVVGPYWPPERRWIETGYADLALPFPRVEAPAFEMALSWTLDELVGYLGTWSATQRYRADRGSDPLPTVRAALAAAWGDVGAERRVRWPLTVHACRKPLSG
jgi:SAM-dependent methyltransferase